MRPGQCMQQPVKLRFVQRFVDDDREPRAFQRVAQRGRRGGRDDPRHRDTTQAVDQIARGACAKDNGISSFLS